MGNGVITAGSSRRSCGGIGPGRRGGICRPEFGSWQTVWKRLDRWSGDGTLDTLLAAAHGDAEIAGELEWMVSVDSTIARAHHHAAGARKSGVENFENVTEDTGGRIE